MPEKQPIRAAVLAELENNRGSYISGEALAKTIGCSRNAIWKAVQKLKSEGYPIESSTRKGHCLSETSDILSAKSVARYLSISSAPIECHKTIDSTNQRAKELGEQGAPEGTLIIAEKQTAGKGRQGRSFYSPDATGVYFTVLLRPQLKLEETPLITTFAACTVAQAIEAIFGTPTEIKWVNDIFVNARKVCGILTEANFSAESGELSYAVLGIGINIGEPDDGFPDPVAGSIQRQVKETTSPADLRSRVVAEIVNRFFDGYATIAEKDYLTFYRSHSLLTGKKVLINERNNEYFAEVLDIDDDFNLKIRLEDGTVKKLNQGEVHIPSSQLAPSN